MNWLKEYIDYLNDNPERYWFKRKLFGWGWTPATWEGWTVIAVFIVLLIALSATIDETAPLEEALFSYFLPLGVLVGAVVAIAYAKGEKPKWMWGVPKKKTPSDTSLPR